MHAYIPCLSPELAHACRAVRLGNSAARSCCPALRLPPPRSNAEKGRQAKEGGLVSYGRKLRELMEHATQFPEEYSKVRTPPPCHTCAQARADWGEGCSQQCGAAGRVGACVVRGL